VAAQGNLGRFHHPNEDSPMSDTKYPYLEHIPTGNVHVWDEVSSKHRDVRGISAERAAELRSGKSKPRVETNGVQMAPELKLDVTLTRIPADGGKPEESRPGEETIVVQPVHNPVATAMASLYAQINKADGDTLFAIAAEYDCKLAADDELDVRREQLISHIRTTMESL
jgi:hypothetical protein